MIAEVEWAITTGEAAEWLEGLRRAATGAVGEGGGGEGRSEKANRKGIDGGGHANDLGSGFDPYAVLLGNLRLDRETYYRLRGWLRQRRSIGEGLRSAVGSGMQDVGLNGEKNDSMPGVPESLSSEHVGTGDRDGRGKGDGVERSDEVLEIPSGKKRKRFGTA